MTTDGAIHPASIAIVGAGVAGLASAAELAASATVTVFDRLPAVGGVLGYEHPLVRALQDEASAAGAAMDLGTTVLRREDGRVLVAGPDGIRWLAVDALVFAGGSRPATLAEGPIAGSRLAGVLPAPVAEHLLEAEVLLGHRVVVTGGGHWARAVLARLVDQNCTVTFVAEDEDAAADGAGHADAVLTGWRPIAVEGRGRIAETLLERDGRRMRLACDALVLAGGERPLRNVDGAVLEPAPGVAYVQPFGPRMGAAEVAAAARGLAARINVATEGAPAAPKGVS
jgi:hypothetical protein